MRSTLKMEEKRGFTSLGLSFSICQMGILILGLL